MSPKKAPETVKLNLRLPKDVHRQLVLAAKQNNVSLNTWIINQMGARTPEQTETFNKILKSEEMKRYTKTIIERAAHEIMAAKEGPSAVQEVLHALVRAGKLTAEDAIAAGVGRLPPAPEAPKSDE